MNGKLSNISKLSAFAPTPSIGEQWIVHQPARSNPGALLANVARLLRPSVPFMGFSGITSVIEDLFLYCRNCNAVHHVTPFDRAPVYDLQEMVVEETVVDDRRQFVDRHAGHEIENFRSVGAECYYIGRPIDPMKVGYVEVTNGYRSYMLRASRETIADALSYKVVPGLWQ